MHILETLEIPKRLNMTYQNKTSVATVAPSLPTPKPSRKENTHARTDIHTEHRT